MFKVLFIIVVGIFSVFSLTQTSYFICNYLSTENVEKVFFKTDNIILNIVVVLFTIIAIYLLAKLLKKLKLSNKYLVLGCIAIFFVVGTYLVFNLKIEPRVDMNFVYSAAKDSIENEFELFKEGGYLYRFPYQISFVAYIESLLRIFKGADFRIVQFFNVVSICILFWYMYLIIKKLTKEDLSIKISIITMFMFAPIYGYIFIVYGNVIGLMFAVVSVYYILSYLDNKKSINLLFSIITIALAINLKSNYLIFFIAESIVLIYYCIKDRDYKLILVILASFILNKTMFKVTEMYYETRSGFQLEEGTPKNLWIAMGMQDNNHMAHGWFNNYINEVYIREKYDSNESKKIANKEISNRVKVFAKHPRYAYEFYKVKITSQVNEPTFQSIWLTQPWYNENYTNKVNNNRILKSLYAGTLYKYYENYCDIILIIIYSFSVLYCIINFKDKQFKNSIFIIIMLGGIAFHILWEGKSQYIWPYVFCIIPYAGIAVSNIFMFIESKINKNNIKLLEDKKIEIQ